MTPLSLNLKTPSLPVDFAVSPRTTKRALCGIHRLSCGVKSTEVVEYSSISYFIEFNTAREATIDDLVNTARLVSEASEYVRDETRVTSEILYSVYVNIRNEVYTSIAL